jgi:hypothetical protein
VGEVGAEHDLLAAEKEYAAFDTFGKDVGCHIHSFGWPS